MRARTGPIKAFVWRTSISAWHLIENRMVRKLGFYGRCHIWQPRGQKVFRGPLNMDVKEQQKIYLAKAKEAEELAEKAPDTGLQKAWLKVAESYRHLAQCFS